MMPWSAQQRSVAFVLLVVACYQRTAAIHGGSQDADNINNCPEETESIQPCSCFGDHEPNKEADVNINCETVVGRNTLSQVASSLQRMGAVVNRFEIHMYGDSNLPEKVFAGLPVKELLIYSESLSSLKGRAFSQIPRLYYLDLKLQAPDLKIEKEAFYDMNTLHTLSVESHHVNLYQNIFSGTANLRHLHLSLLSKPTDFNAAVFRGFPPLVELHLGGKLSSISEADFSSLTHLQTLNISNSHLEYLYESANPERRLKSSSLQLILSGEK